MSAEPQYPRIPEITLPWRLRISRVEADLGQQEFADRIGISKGSVINYEKGKTTPSRPVLLSWAMATSVEVQWLQNGTVPGPLNGPGTDAPCPPRDSNSEPADSGRVVALFGDSADRSTIPSFPDCEPAAA